MEKIIQTEKRNPLSTDIDLLSSREVVEIINTEDKKVPLAVEKKLDKIAEAVDIVSEAFLNGGSLLYFGAGTSGRLGILDASECPPTFSVPGSMVRGYIAGGDTAIKTAVEGAEDNFDAGRQALIDAQATSKDVVAVISASGNAPYILGVLDKAAELGVKTIGIACNTEAKLRSRCEVFICPVVGPEVLTGSSRLKAGTAQKLVLNMLTTASMIRIGKVYENYMIDVAPTNIKLRDRAARIVSEIADITYKEACKLLELSDYRVKPAVVMALGNINLIKAEELLGKHNGRLREALKNIS